MISSVTESLQTATRNAGGQTPRVLCVDDDQLVLAALQRMLRGKFEVRGVTEPILALKLVDEAVASPFAVIVSDLSMPGIDGITLLTRIREIAPYTVRVLLTGRADIDSATRAVNDGAVFRFLTKPCGPTDLVGAVSAAAEHSLLIRSERELLEQTLHGSVKALTDILTLVNPSAFARGTRLKRYVGYVSEPLGVTNQWEIEIAALLSQLGSVSLSPALIDKLHSGAELDDDEQRLANGVPRVAASLICEIPRLGDVCRILELQSVSFDGTNSPRAGMSGDSLPLGARILKIANDLDVLEAGGMAAGVAIGTLASRIGTYDPRVLAVFRRVIEEDADPVRVRHMRLGGVVPGMVFAMDVTSPTGLLLAARGQEVGRALSERLRYSMPESLLDQEVVVIVPVGIA